MRLQALATAGAMLLVGMAAAQAEQVEIQPRMGQPLPGLTPAQASRFQLGAVQFNRVWTAIEGRGPVFNQNGCASCHNSPAAGGSGTIEVTRFGTASKEGFDPLDNLGGSLLQSQANSLECAEIVPPEATIIANRITPSVLGLGLIESIADDAIEFHALNPPPGIQGVVHWVQPLEGPQGVLRAGRFGWKAQVATALTFSGDASLNEMGITNRLAPDENAPNGDADLLAQCDTVPDPEDRPDESGAEFIDRITDFQRFLAAPPQTPRSGMTGEFVFEQIRCAECHVPSFTTRDDVTEDALRSKTIRPYSDFLLHDMGALADGIVQGMAGERMMRTPPLWGLRKRQGLLHDGRADNGDFAQRVTDAIVGHGALFSEAGPSVALFNALPNAQRQMLIRFLDSLGRAEFDHDGDGDVDLADYQVTNGCAGAPDDELYTADDDCAVSDLDQDGDVDLLDFAGFQRAVH